MDLETILEYFPEANRLNVKLRELLKFISSKDDFLRVFLEYGETCASEIYLEIMNAVINAVSAGNVQVLEMLCTTLQWIHGTKHFVDITRQLKVAHPLQSTNLIILACKNCKIEILKWLYNNVDIVQLLSAAVVTPACEDEEGHTAMYYAVRSNDTNLLDCLLTENCNEDILSKSYWELTIKNVLLSDNVHFYIQNKLINLRYSTNNTVNITPSDNEKRIQLLLEQNKIIQDEYYLNPVDEKLLCILKFMALNIRFLKGTKKAIQTILPWEEMEFCLVIFIAARLKVQELNMFYLTVIPKETLLKYLNSFFELLDKSKRLTPQKSGRPIRNLVIADIIKENPHFIKLYADYYEIKDVYSLNMMKTYIEAALVAESDTREGQLIMKRAIQVVGEHLKNTMDSPNLSDDVSELILLSAPTATKKILTGLRNSLSHAHILNDNVHSLYDNILNDMKKLANILTEIFYTKKVIKIQEILNDILNCEDWKTMAPLLEAFRGCSTDSLDILFGNRITTEFHKMEKIIESLSNEFPEKTEYERGIFEEINLLLFQHHIYFDSEVRRYLETFNNLTSSIFSADIIYDDKMFLEKKFLAKMFLQQFKIQSHSKNFDMSKIVKLLDKLYNNSLDKLSKQVDYKIQDLIWKFNFLNVCGNKDIKWINTLSEMLLKFNVKKPKLGPEHEENLPNLEDEVPDNLQNNISELKSIFDNENVRIFQLRKKLNMKTKNNNRFFFEMLMLNAMNSVDSFEGLNSNPLFLDNYIPLLSGKSLRNHLAHENSLIHILSTNINNVLLSNAKILSDHTLIKVVKSNSTVKQNIAAVKQMQDDGLSIIEKQKQMFLALSDGNLEIIKKCVKDGADVHSRKLSSWSTVHEAAQHQHQQVLRYLLQCGVQANVKDNQGQNPLHVAAAHGQEQNIRYLTEECGLQPDDTDNNGKTALHIASLKGHEESVVMLLKLGASWLILDNDGHAPLHYAVIKNHKYITEILLEKEANVDSNKTKYNYSALHLASRHNCLELVDYLILKNANVNNSADDGVMPLHSAIINGNTLIVEVLIKAGADVNIAFSDASTTPLAHASFMGNKDIARNLLEAGALVQDATPLCFAAQRGFKEIVELLIERGSDVNCIKNDLTPLMFAANGGNNDIVQFLHSKGATLHNTDGDGYTALHLSAMRGHTEVVKYLISVNFYIDVESRYKYTPLHLAIKHRNTKTSQFLLKNGANIHAVTSKGTSPLHFSSFTGNYCITETLLEKGAKVNLMNANKHAPLHNAVMSDSFSVDTFNLLLKYGADVNFGANLTPAENTPLHAAAFFGNLLAVKVLIKEMATIDAETIYKETPLHIAIRGNNEDIVKILLDNGANVNKVAKDFISPLCLAISSNFKDLVILLLAKGADVNFGGGKPLQCAIYSGHDKLLDLLLKNKSINVNLKDPLGMTPLHVTAACLSSYRMAQPLLDKGADIESCMMTDVTPAILAMQMRNKNFLDLLFLNGATISPRHLYNEIGCGNLVVVQSFLESGAGYLSKGFLTKILNLSVLAGQLEVTKYLIYKGADVNSKSIVITKSQEGYLLEKNIDLENKYISGGTPLHYATLIGSKDIVEYLILKGSNLNAIDAGDMQPIHIAAQRGHTSIVKLLMDNGAMYNYKNKSDKRPIDYSSKKDIKHLFQTTDSLFTAVKKADTETMISLLNKEACVNASVQKNNSTLLHFAAWKGDKNVCDLLLTYQANTNTLNKSTPLHYAAKFSNFDFVLSLLSHGAVYNSQTEKGNTPQDLSVDPQIKNLFEQLNSLFLKAESGVDIFNELIAMNNFTKKAMLKARNKNNKTLVVVTLAVDYSKISNFKQMLWEESCTPHNIFKKENLTITLETLEKQLKESVEFFGLDSPITLEVERDIATNLFLQSKYEEAQLIEEKIYEKMCEVLGANSQPSLCIKYNLAHNLFAQGKYADSLKMSQEIYKQQVEILEKDSNDVVSTALLMAESFKALGNEERALKILQNILKEQKCENTFALIIWEKMTTFLCTHEGCEGTCDIIKDVMSGTENITFFPF